MAVSSVALHKQKLHPDNPLVFFDVEVGARARRVSECVSVECSLACASQMKARQGQRW